MKTRAIPAQITTVEDKIAGNLNLTQISLLMLPVFSLMVIYALLPKPMQFTFYKIPLVLVIAIISGVLSLRVKGKVIFNWVIILLKYNSRPSFYVFDKNERYMRDISFPAIKKKQRKLFLRKKSTDVKKNIIHPSTTELVRFDNFVSSPNMSFSIKVDRKGGLNVAIEQKQS